MKSPPAADQTKASQSKKLFFIILWLNFSLSSPILDSTTIETLLICKYEKFTDDEMPLQSITMKCNGDRLRKGQQQCYGNVVLILILIKSHRPGETHRVKALPCHVTRERWGEGQNGPWGDFWPPGGHFGLCLVAINNCSHGDHLRCCWVLTWCLFGNNKDKRVKGLLQFDKFKLGQGWSVMVTRQGRGNLFQHQSAMKWVIKESLYQL